MDFSIKLLNQFHLYQQITIIKNKWLVLDKKLAKKLNLRPTCRKPAFLQQLIPPETQSSCLSCQTGGLCSISFLETFRISCGELIEQVRTLKLGIGAI